MSGVSVHGQCAIIVDGQSSSTSATSDWPAPADSSAARTPRGSVGSSRSGVPGQIAMNSVNAVTRRKPTWIRCQCVARATRAKK